MWIKQHTKKGEKYYIDAFTGVQKKIPNIDPLKREPDMTLQGLMTPRVNLGFADDYRKVLNSQRSAFIGEFKEIMKVSPKKRDWKEFSLICKRVNLNPWELMDTTYWDYYNVDKPIKKAPESPLPAPKVIEHKTTFWSFLLNFLKRLF